ncbi:M20/M25/M40 family metallo-hydrolase [Shewanella sp. JM162201]|uniref:Carboxypeptidase Q n=1 Tax=Shewanella jiangmenensis TaxID=2837387 RepID=A0ABS5UZB2_9GAMM|nr:M20/M25/M40 family metallo-hydrolase [Shewanella jiangmenensis]MBT1443526.1 M20/M25/M40 family metallo-hydrolase [Shewanella jiangmenensis]
MKTLPLALLSLGLLVAANSQANQTTTDKNHKVAISLANTAAQSSLAYELVESLTVEVGPRLAGSDQDKVAVDWAMAKLKSLGFERVYKEPVTVPVWHRGIAKANIVSPYPQPMVITALGGSIATPKGGITAEVARFDSLDALKAAPEGSLKGKIAFIDAKTERHRDGAGYGKTSSGRSKGAVAAAEKGAVAIIIRSIGTDTDRMAHTGMMRYQDGVEPIPAAAVSNPDADMINAMLKRTDKVSLHLELGSERRGEATSYNVIAEVSGSSKADEIVLIGAHLDSWDEGTGAIDDGAGVAIVTAAAKHILDLPAKPQRTVRVVLYAAEEVGLIGGKTYAKAHEAELAKHYIAAESDFGAGRIYQIDWNVAPRAHADAVKLMHAAEQLGVSSGNNQASGGPDVSMLPALGVPVASLRQDGSDYFDYHHTPNDTLDKIDPAALAQNVAVYAQFAWMMANSELELRPLAPKPQAQ